MEKDLNAKLLHINKDIDKKLTHLYGNELLLAKALYDRFVDRGYLDENKEFDLTDKRHWETVHKRFTDYGIKPIIIEPMPNEVHDHIKAGDEKRDECIEKAIKMLPLMRKFDIDTICFNFMAHIGWLRTRSDYPERGGAKVTAFDAEDFKETGAEITEAELWKNYEYFIRAMVPEAEKYGIKYLFSDFKKKNGYKRSCELSEEYGIYRQNYCGCVFSKKEREIG